MGTQSSPWLLNALFLAHTVSCIGLRNKIGPPADSQKRFKQVPVVEYK